MKTRTITALIILAIVTPLILIGQIPFYLFVAVIITCTMLEIFNASNSTISNEKEELHSCKQWPWFLKIILIIEVLVSTFYPFIQNFIFEGKLEYPIYPNSFGDYPILYVPAIVMFITIFTLFAGAIFSEKIKLSDVFYIGLMTIFISLAGQATIVCRESGEKFNVFIYIILVCVMTDTFAYFCGYLFGRHGRHKINPRISPKKSWEGAIGGTIFGALIPFAITFALPLGYQGLNWWGILLISIILSITAQFGDFTFSAIKRYFKIKDFGKIFPGHGGILDRLDSIFYNMIVMAIIVTTLSGANIIIF